MKVEYSIDYSCGDHTIPMKSVSMDVPAGSSALQVMEKAANSDKEIQFTAKYYDDDNVLGFDIETINGIPKLASECCWEFLIQFPDGSKKPSRHGVSNYYFDTDGYGMIMRLTKTPTCK